MAVMTGLSGNEMYCLRLKGYDAGELVVGNSVYSMGFLGSIGAGFSNLMGGEVRQVTEVISAGRQASLARLVNEARHHGGVGVTGVTSELKHFHGNVEFLSVGSTVHRKGMLKEPLEFTTAHDAQELFCMIDAGYEPKRFVFGNVAYSVGVTGGILGGLKAMARGEIKEFSDVFNRTRHLALERICHEAMHVQDGMEPGGRTPNAVVGIETSVMPFQGVHEMMMTGTACVFPKLPPVPPGARPITSDLTAEEMWNIAAMGYVPMKLVLGTAVYSLGIVGGVMAALKSFGRGEINELTSLIYEAREHAIGLIRQEAEAIGADDVVGIKTHIHDLGSLLEFMAIGTAVKRMDGVEPGTPMLPAQAVIRDRDTWITESAGHFVIKDR